jgi:predicted ATPase/DNA-binding winged helix-turn-helix (wHTH) protein
MEIGDPRLSRRPTIIGEGGGPTGENHPAVRGKRRHRRGVPIVQLPASIPFTPVPPANRFEAMPRLRAAPAQLEAESVLEFGRFQLLPCRRQLLADGRPVELGERAFDIAMVLAEARGLLVTKDELLNRVWPDRVVEENNLQVQISALRKAFGADRGFIVTISGRGYRFTADVQTKVTDPARLVRPDAADRGWRDNLPAGVADVVGRELEVEQLLDLIAAHRLVTVTGSAGVGKTHLALEAARRLLSAIADGVWLADLAPLADPERVRNSVMRSLPLEPHPDLPPCCMTAALRSKRLLLLLDNCEHLVDPAALTAEALLHAGPDIRILATSGEPLRVEGEHLFRLEPLSVPESDDAGPEEAMRHGALQLLLGHLRSADPNFVLDSRATALATMICRRLDGLPLAIELAAARAAGLGLQAVAAGLDDRFHLLTEGRRTGPGRHRTLEAALDWSWRLLTPLERNIAMRLGSFSGAFSLDDAAAAAAAGAISRQAVLDGVASLVGKSLLSVHRRGVAPQYRFPETTRAYLVRQISCGEASRAA